MADDVKPVTLKGTDQTNAKGSCGGYIAKHHIKDHSSLKIFLYISKKL